MAQSTAKVLRRPRIQVQPVFTSHHDFFQTTFSLCWALTPTVLDVTAGGGSIPFEAGRLGLKTIANELNPVAALILHATCEWPQRYGGELRRQYGRELGIGKYDGIFGRYLKRVRELLEGVYPDVGQPKWMAEWNDKYKAGIDSGQITRAKRYDQTYLFARVISCPSCNGQIPLSPNWRLDSTGSGIRLLPDIAKRTCGFEIVSTAAEQSPWHDKPRHSHLPVPRLRSGHSEGVYRTGSAGGASRSATLRNHLPRPVAGIHEERETQKSA